MGIPLLSEVADFAAALASGRDIGTVRGPTLLVVLHSVLLGCLCRPVVDTRPDGKGRRHWLASLALFLAYILGGTTVTAVLLGLRPCWMVSDRVWLFYALGWLLAGLLPVRRAVLQSPAKVFFAVAHALTRVSFVSGAVAAADTACPRGLLAAVFVPVFNSHGMDWLTTPLFLALEGRPLVPCTDWISPSPFASFFLFPPLFTRGNLFSFLTHHTTRTHNRGLQNTFCAALGYYVLSGRAWGAPAATGLRAWLANAALVAPLVVDAVGNMCLGLGVCAWGPVARLAARGVARVHRVRDALNRACEQGTSATTTGDLDTAPKTD